MSQHPTRTTEDDQPDQRGQTQPHTGRDRSHDPKEQPPGGGADQAGPQASEEAQNQAATADKSRADSGTP